MSYLGYYEYVYDGPVMLFEKCVSHRWIATTSAPSESKARSNLAYRYKKETGLAPNARVFLPGKFERRDLKERI